MSLDVLVEYDLSVILQGYLQRWSLSQCWARRLGCVLARVEALDHFVLRWGQALGWLFLWIVGRYSQHELWLASVPLFCEHEVPL